MNKIQKLLRNALIKAAGFPPWTGSTSSIPPGGWGSFEPGGGSYSSAAAIAAVYACWRIICQTVGSVPWRIYRTVNGQRVEAFDHPLYPILHSSPNAYMTSMEFREAIVLGFLSRGNGYAEKSKIGNRVVGLNPLPADRVTPRMKNGSAPYQGPGLVYDFHQPDGTYREIPYDQIIHLKNFSLDGITGISPLSVNAIQNSAYTERYAATWMRNQGRPSGVLQTDKEKPKDANDYSDRLKRDWKTLNSGDNAGDTAVLWGGMKYEPISITPNEAQYIESRKMNVADIGSIYGVMLNMLNQTDKSATYASAEQFAIDFVTHTARPNCVRIEQVFNKALFSLEPGVFCEFDLDDLRRGDMETQAQYYKTLTDGGIFTRNEARRALNKPARPEADQLTVRSYEIDLNALPRLSQAADPATISETDIRKELPAPAPDSGFHMHVRQEVLPQPPMKKKGKAWRDKDGTLRFEIEEIEIDPDPEEKQSKLATILPARALRQKGRAQRDKDGVLTFEIEDNNGA